MTTQAAKQFKEVVRSVVLSVSGGSSKVVPWTPYLTPKTKYGVRNYLRGTLSPKAALWFRPASACRAPGQDGQAIHAQAMGHDPQSGVA